jgi:hypothetical protein
MELLTVWHGMRSDLEQKLAALTGDSTVVEVGQKGTFKKQVFQGHCTENGGSGYVPLSGKPETLKRLSEIYT